MARPKKTTFNARDLQILAYVRDGLHHNQIAAKIGCSRSTIENSIRFSQTRLGTSGSKATAKRAEAGGILPSKPSTDRLEEKPPASKKKPTNEFVYSHPTMCLHCHLIVEMVHARGADPQKGAWNCPRCGHIYPFRHWQIKKQVRGRAEAS